MIEVINTEINKIENFIKNNINLSYRKDKK